MKNTCRKLLAAFCAASMLMTTHGLSTYAADLTIQGRPEETYLLQSNPLGLSEAYHDGLYLGCTKRHLRYRRKLHTRTDRDLPL